MPAFASRSSFLMIMLMGAISLSACGDNTPKPSEQKTTAQAPTQSPSVQEQSSTTPEPASDSSTQTQHDTATPASSPAPTPAVASTDQKILALGKARYEQSCHLCHTQGLLNAPKMTDKTAWQPRLAKGIDTLHHNAIHGFGKMPAQAVDGISPDEVKAAVDYMVSQVAN